MRTSLGYSCPDIMMINLQCRYKSKTGNVDGTGNEAALGVDYAAFETWCRNIATTSVGDQLGIVDGYPTSTAPR